MTSEEQIEYWYKELHRLMWAMVWEHANPECWSLHPDDIFGELSVELVKVVLAYSDKPYIELKRILIVSLRNRCSDLMTMMYKTHRSAESDMLSLSADDSDDSEYANWLPLKGVGRHDPHFDLNDVPLSDDGRKLAEEVVDPSEHTLVIMSLFCARKSATSPKNHWKLQVTPLLMRRALGWDRSRLENAWEELQDVFKCI